MVQILSVYIVGPTMIVNLTPALLELEKKNAVNHETREIF